MPEATATATAPATAAPAPAPAAAPAAAATAPSPAPAPTADAPAEAKSALLGGEGEDEPFSWDKVEAKFVVKNDKGEIDKDATAGKLAKSYSEIQKRASRGGEVRPKTAAEYVVTAPEAMKDVITAEDPGVKAFLGKAHAAGYTQKQIDLAIQTYADLAPSLVKGATALDANAAEAALRTVWPTDGEFDSQIALADRAVAQLAPGDKELLKDVQNRPSVIRLLAKIGAQLGEDSPPAADIGSSGGYDVRADMNSPAYSDASHIDHQKVTKRVNAWHARQPGAGTPL